MKKLLLFLTLTLTMCGCDRIYVGNTTLGKKTLVPIQKGDIRLTITSDYTIVEECDGDNGLSEPWWKCVDITNNDSITKELILRLKKD